MVWEYKMSSCEGFWKKHPCTHNTTPEFLTFRYPQFRHIWKNHKNASSFTSIPSWKKREKSPWKNIQKTEVMQLLENIRTSKSSARCGDECWGTERWVCWLLMNKNLGSMIETSSHSFATEIKKFRKGTFATIQLPGTPSWLGQVLYGFFLLNKWSSLVVIIFLIYIYILIQIHPCIIYHVSLWMGWPSWHFDHITWRIQHPSRRKNSDMNPQIEAVWSEVGMFWLFRVLLKWEGHKAPPKKSLAIVRLTQPMAKP